MLFMGGDVIVGKMEDYIKGNGKIILWMVSECMFGQTEEYIKVSMQQIKNKDLEYINGKMAKNTKAGG